MGDLGESFRSPRGYFQLVQLYLFRAGSAYAILFLRVLFTEVHISAKATFLERGQALGDNRTLFASNIFSVSSVYKDKINSVGSKTIISISGIFSVVIYMFLLIWSVSDLIIGSHNPFIYFNF